MRDGGRTITRSRLNRFGAVSLIVVGLALGAGGGVARSDPPDIAEIICHADGSTTLLTPEIRTQPDGVHAWVINRRGVSAYPSPAFQAGYVPTGAKEVIATTPPGEWVVACWNHGEGLRDEQRRAQTLTIRDVGGYWTDTKLDCPPGEGNGGWVSDFMSPGPQPPGFLSEAELRSAASREWNLQPDDRVELAGYPEQIGTRVRVVRDGRIVGTAALGRSEGRVVPTGGSFCSGLRSKIGQ